jgi:hypothetical protein
MSFDTLTVIVLMNVVATFALWLESKRRAPEPKLKKKFVKRLLHSKPITPKHQPPSETNYGGGPKDQLFFDDFADFANVVNQGFADWSRWRLQELPNDYSLFEQVPSANRSYAVFYNQAQVGKLAVEAGYYHADHPNVTTYIHLDCARWLPFDTIRDFLTSIAGDTCCHDDKEYFKAQQTIDHAMMEVLWRSNHLDVENYRLPDIGEINLQLSGIASEYLKSRDNLRNQATSTAQADETMKKLAKTETQKSTKRWSLARAAFYGLLLSGVAFAANVITGPPDQWLRAPPAELLAYLAGNFAPAPIIFVLIAATRNAFYGLRPW